MMAEGPPPSEATSSKARTPWYASYPQPATGTPTPSLYQPYVQTGNPYSAHYAPYSYFPQYHQSQPATYFSQPIQPQIQNSQPPKPPSPSPSPPLPDPETYKHWDVVIRAFFLKTGLIQALKGLEADMLVLNPEWEQLKILPALEEMIKGLKVRSFFFLVFFFF